MTIADKIARAKDDIDAVFEAGNTQGIEVGKKAEYDRFWDSYQKKGEVYSAQYMYAQTGWNDETFKPKYSQKYINGAGNMFNSSGITDLKGILESRGLIFDFKNCTNFLNFLGYSKLTRVPLISTVKAANLNSFAYSAQNLISIDEIILKNDGSQTFTDAFRSCKALEEIRFSGKIGKSIDFQWSTKLSKASILSIFNALYDNGSNAQTLTLTLSLDAVNKAFETSEGANNGANSEELAEIVVWLPLCWKVAYV